MKLYSRDGSCLMPTFDDDFVPEKIFECGQCFRWNRDPDGVYTGVAHGEVLKLWAQANAVYLSCDQESFERIWRSYFDLDLQYGEIRKSFAIDDFMYRAVSYGAGIRILKQDKWEALCSFIISQCNNIPRIKKIVEIFCREFGRSIETENGIYYAFPDAETTAQLRLSDLEPLRCGYRGAYILDAARAVSTGRLDLEALSKGSFAAAVCSLRTIDGVGEKVANCAALYGLHMLSAFPVDVWMKKIIAKQYGGKFDPAVFGEYAGIAQQYMFYFARDGEILQEGKSRKIERG